ncbi:hypothetical protein MCHI_003168 [Candidatus Magnetoovum chiemensis]|nr:hypothetical protein MCHI_003168 [Candidatus Magnetoovum chiemensis]
MNNLDEEVKQLMIALEQGTNFNDIFNLFFDLHEKSEFQVMGKLKKNKKIKETISFVTKRIIKDGIMVNFLAIIVDKYKLWHGAFFINGQLSTYFYFEKLDMGMLAVSRGGGRTEFGRFTLYKNKDAFFTDKKSAYDN